MVTELKRKLGLPRNLFFAECTPRAAFIPYGNGNQLLNQSDLYESLRGIDAIEGGPGEAFRAQGGVRGDEPQMERYIKWFLGVHFADNLARGGGISSLKRRRPEG